LHTHVFKEREGERERNKKHFLELQSPQKRKVQKNRYFKNSKSRAQKYF
jgi:hypothetical protein